MHPLRKQLLILDAIPDWRRDGPAPGITDLAAAFVSESAEWPVADSLEGQALLAIGYRDAASAVESLCGLASVSLERRAWALQRIAVTCKFWAKFLERFAPADRTAHAVRAIGALRRLAAGMPGNPAVHAALADTLRGSGHMDAAIAQLERSVLAGVPLAAMLLRVLVDELDRAPSAAVIERLSSVHPGVLAADESAAAVFRVRRAISFATMAAPLGDRAPALPADIDAGEDAIRRAMDEALGLAARLGPARGSSLLAELAGSALFRHSHLDTVEQARVALIEACFRDAEVADVPEVRLRALGTLSKMLPSCVRFWSEPPWRRTSSARVVALADGLTEPMRNWFRGRFAFAAEDYDLAAEAFAAVDPPAGGVSTYVDHRAVGRIVASRAGAGLLGGQAGTFEVLSEGNDSAGPIVVVSANDRYIHRHLEAYAKSLARVAPSGRLHVHLVGEPATVRDKLARARALLPRSRITFSSEPISIDAPYYFATARFLRLSDWLQGAADPVIVSDIDILWSTPPARLVERVMGDADVGLVLRQHVRVGRYAGLHHVVNSYPLAVPWMVAQANMVVAMPTAASRAFADLLARLSDHVLRRAMSNPSRVNWAIDQNILCAAYAYAVREQPAIAFADLGGLNEIRDLPEGAPPPRGRHWLGDR